MMTKMALASRPLPPRQDFAEIGVFYTAVRQHSTQTHCTMKAYLDNNIVSAILKDDIAAESTAINQLLELHDQGSVLLVTSELALAEMANAPQPYVARLRRAYHLLSKIPVVSWSKLTHMQRSGRPGGSQVIWPVFENEPLFSQFLSTGLTEADAQHLFVAAKQTCAVFITCDNSRKTGILARAHKIQSLCGMAVQRPSEFIASNFGAVGGTGVA